MMHPLFKRLPILWIGIFITTLLSVVQCVHPKHTDTIEHKINDATLSISYNRPYKEKHVVFGDAIPFHTEWRIGDGSPTILSIDHDLKVDGSVLKIGTYTLWAIPKPNSWKIIFNTQKEHWTSFFSKAIRNPKHDVLIIEVPTIPLLHEVPQFTMYIEDANGFSLLYLTWDRTAVAIPIQTLSNH